MHAGMDIYEFSAVCTVTPPVQRFPLPADDFQTLEQLLLSLQPHHGRLSHSQSCGESVHIMY